MPRIIYIHNKEDESCRKLLTELKASYKESLEVYDFMDVRDKVWFRGCPTVLILPDGSTGLAEARGSVKLELDVTKDEINESIKAVETGMVDESDLSEEKVSSLPGGSAEDRKPEDRSADLEARVSALEEKVEKLLQTARS